MSRSGSVLVSAEDCLMEVVSSLQKEIRRCNEKAALFWAWEMQESRGEKNPCGYAKYLWKRLAVIASEDIGLVNPMCAMAVASLAANYERVTENFKKPPMQACVSLGQAILMLARSPKNREVDDACMWIEWERASGRMLPIPDYALDRHTQRGKAKQRGGLQFFYQEACKLENVQGGNHYVVEGEVNRDRYEHHDLASTAKWESVTTDPLGKPDRLMKEYEEFLKVV